MKTAADIPTACRATPAALVRGAVLSAVLSAAALPAAAQMDCGDPPLAEPAIPEGEGADRDQMMTAIRAVKVYSAAIDAYLECKDRRAVKVFQWMTEEQRARWDEDVLETHNERVEVQRRMNEEIRDFNAQTANAGNPASEDGAGEN